MRWFYRIAFALAGLISAYGATKLWNKGKWFVVPALILSTVSVAAFYGAVTQDPISAFASGGAGGIRQEINIIDAWLGAASGSFATSSAIVQFDGTKYTAPSAYFEVVASTSASIATQVFLRNATSSATVATINIPTGTTGYTRLRSSEITSMASTTQNLVVVVASTTGATKGVIAARIVVLDSGSPLSSTQTQIEIGNHETFTTTATTTFSSPKYWYYNSAGWDGSPTFYAEITYQVIGGAASAQVDYSNGTHTVTYPGGTASTSVGLRGAGGAGAGASASSVGGYGGGGGGAYARSILIATTSTHTLVVGAGVTGVTTNPAPSGATSTYDGTMVVADAGRGANTTVAGRGGLAYISIGQFRFDGGDGATGLGVGAASGGGGEGGGTTANGGDAIGTAGGTGTDGGDGGAGSAVEANGGLGVTDGAGGGGAMIADATDHAGGTSGRGSGSIITYVATTTVVLQADDGQFGSWTDVANTYMVHSGYIGGGAATRIRSSAFTPTNGKHYRIALRKNDSRTVVAIYNAKIVVDQGPFSAQLLQDTSNNICSITGASGTAEECGQSFTTDTNTWVVSSVQAYLQRNGTISDNIVMNIYSDSGFTTSLKNVSIVGSTVNDEYQTFTLSSSLTLSPSTTYYIGLSRSGARDASNLITWLINTVDVYAGGTRYKKDSGVWSTQTGDEKFKVNYTVSSPTTLLEPQYLLANTKLAAGTGLQDYDTSFATADWTTTNNYMHAVSAADNSTSVVEVDDTTGPTQITGSTVTSPDNYATSTGMCLTSNYTLDSKATTNNSDIYSSSIIVQVGVASTASCDVGPPPPPPPPGARMRVNTNMQINSTMIVR